MANCKKDQIKRVDFVLKHNIHEEYEDKLGLLGRGDNNSTKQKLLDRFIKEGLYSPRSHIFDLNLTIPILTAINRRLQ